MKKIFLMAAVAVFGFTQVNAQEGGDFGFDEGDIFIEGSVGFSSTNNKNTDVKSNTVLVMPKAGYFITDKFAAGVGLGFGSYKQETGSTINDDESSFAAGLFARYYFLELGNRFKTYSEFGVGYGSTNDKIADAKLNTISAGLDLGVNYFVTEKIAVTFALTDILSFKSKKADASGAKPVSSFNFGVGSVNNPFATASFGILFKL
ncbi:MAG: outer membrane beta-barrel protein [Xanthomarina sp.]